MLKKLIIFPFGGNSREALLAVLAVNKIKKQWDVIGFIDDDASKKGKACCSVRVLGDRKTLKKYPGAFVLAVPGNPDDYLKRKGVIDSLGIDNKRFATIVDPSAVVSPDAEIGLNTLLMANVFVSCGSRVGNHCVILPNSVISHDSVIGDYSLVGSNVSISSNVAVGRVSYIGSGSRIREKINIGNGTLIGLGSNVVSDIRDSVVAAGNPARVLRASA